MSLWPHISARPQLSDGRQGWAICPSHAEPHLHSLDAPTRQLDKRLQRCTLWLCSRSSRPRCSPVRKPVWMHLHTGSTRHHSHRPVSIRVSPLVHDDGDDRQSFLPRCSVFVRQPIWTSCGEGFAERFTEAQAMQHFLPKHTSSSAASSCPRPAPTSQTAKPTPATPESRPPDDWWDRGRSCSTRRCPFLKRQGPWPKITLDPAPQKSSWSARQERGGARVLLQPDHPASSL